MVEMLVLIIVVLMFFLIIGLWCMDHSSQVSKIDRLERELEKRNRQDIKEIKKMVSCSE